MPQLHLSIVMQLPHGMTLCADGAGEPFLLGPELDGQRDLRGLQPQSAATNPETVEALERWLRAPSLPRPPRRYIRAAEQARSVVTRGLNELETSLLG